MDNVENLSTEPGLLQTVEARTVEAQTVEVQTPEQAALLLD